MRTREARTWLTGRLAALRLAAPRILQVCVAAGVAWVVANEALGHTRPFFAPIAVVLTLGLTIGQRGRRAFELALGVALGVGIADLLVLAVGPGTWQLVVVLALVMSVAVLAGGGVLLVNQAAVSAVLVVTLQVPDASVSQDRFLDALVGVAIAMIANAVTPADPVRLVRREMGPLLTELAGILVDVADSLSVGDRRATEAALERARALDPGVREMRAAIKASAETTTLAPTRRGDRTRIARFAEAAEPIDLAIRNTRVLARASIRAIELEENVPPLVIEAIRDLGAAVTALDEHLVGPRSDSAAREAALLAAARASSALEVTSNLSVSVIVGQVRSMATDLLAGLGIADEEAREAVRSARQELGI